MKQMINKYHLGDTVASEKTKSDGSGKKESKNDGNKLDKHDDTKTKKGTKADQENQMKKKSEL